MPAERDLSLSIIVPTLNEEESIQLLLYSLRNSSTINFETLIVDGGSNDKTSNIASQHNAKVVILPRHGEFISRNIGAKLAKGRLLLFTCADIIFPENSFEKIIEKFEKKPALVALTGPGYPLDAPLSGKMEYVAYNLVRYVFAKLPKPFKRFSTSTNFLVIRKDCFDKSGGFLINDINADGLMGKKLLELGEVDFFLDTIFYLSARRMKNMGFFAFNRHYLYVLENFLFSSSELNIIKALKIGSKRRHRKLHEV